MWSGIRALLELSLLYVAFPIFSAYVLIAGILVQNIYLIAYALVYVLFSVLLLLRKVRYDHKFLASINIEEAPPYIAQLLSETTSRGILINQLIIKTINEYPRVSQTELHKKLPVPLSKERIRQFALELEAEDTKIIRDIAGDVSEGKKCVYVLTKRGEWCLLAIRKYYPKYYLSYLVRVILKTHFREKLPNFEDIQD